MTKAFRHEDSLREAPKTENYLSSRDFVAAYDQWAVKHVANYSRRAFAQWAKVKSPNFITLVISGRRSLQGAWLEAFCRTSRLAADQISLLKELCAVEAEKDFEAKFRYLQAYRERLRKSFQASLALHQLDLLRSPLAWTLLQVIELKGSSTKASWFKKQLRSKVSAEEVEAALLSLRSCGLIVLGKGRWIATHAHYSSPDQIQTAENAAFHERMLAEGLDVLRKYDPADRSFGSLTLCVRRRDEDLLKAEIQKFGRYLASTYGSGYPVDGNCYRLNLQLYSLTQTETGK